MRSSTLAFAVALTLSLAACDDDGATPQGPTVRITIEADLSSLPPDMAADEAMEAVKDVIERRAEAFDVSETDITREGEDRLVVQLQSISPEEARDLVGRTGFLEFREPVLNEQQITCTAADATKFFVAPPEIAAGVNATSGAKEMHCSRRGGVTGVVVWTPALSKDSQGQTRQLTSSYIKLGSAEVTEEPSTMIAIQFTDEGGLLFEGITTRLVGYPLGLFLDDELIGAPSVRQAITGGNTVIQGLTLDEAKTIAMLLNAGALPVPVRVISAEQTN